MEQSFMQVWVVTIFWIFASFPYVVCKNEYKIFKK